MPIVSKPSGTTDGSVTAGPVPPVSAAAGADELVDCVHPAIARTARASANNQRDISPVSPGEHDDRARYAVKAVPA
jgi:hypothetical protein